MLARLIVGAMRTAACTHCPQSPSDTLPIIASQPDSQTTMPSTSSCIALVSFCSSLLLFCGMVGLGPLSPPPAQVTRSV